jgi:MFS family permease
VPTFRALRHRNYRLYFFGQLISLTGSWVQTAALMWLAYALTGQSQWPSLVLAAQVLPTFLFGAWAGSLADRWPRRSLIFATQAALLLLAVLLGVQVLAGRVTPWYLLAVSAACGVVNAVDLPARLAFVIDMVGRDDLLNAVALNSLQFNVARAVGPFLGTLVLGWTGPGPCFLLNGLSFVAVLAALACMDLPSGTPFREPRGPGGSLLGGFRYLGRHPALVLLLVLSGAMSLFGWPLLTLLPALADQQLHVSQQGYGGLLSAVGVGALLAALLVASFASLARRYRFLGTGVVLAALSLGGLALTRDPRLAYACCTGFGCGLILFFATSQSVMQLSATDHNRGRVMGIWSMVTSGALPVGSLLAGRAADHWGVPLVVALQGLGIAVAAVAVLLLGLVLPRSP